MVFGVGRGGEWPRPSRSSLQGSGELLAVLDPQLAEGVPQVVLHGLRRYEQGLRDLAVALAGRGVIGDSSFTGGQRAGTAQERVPPRARTGRGELRAGTLADGAGTSLAGQIDR